MTRNCSIRGKIEITRKIYSQPIPALVLVHMEDCIVYMYYSVSILHIASLLSTRRRFGKPIRTYLHVVKRNKTNQPFDQTKRLGGNGDDISDDVWLAFVEAYNHAS